MFLPSDQPCQKCVTLRMYTHFFHRWPLGKKNVSQIFGIWSGNRIIEGNVQGGSDFHLL